VGTSNGDTEFGPREMKINKSCREAAG